MANTDGGRLVAQVLREQNVKYLFSVNGGHIFPILANLQEHGIKLIHVRHEQAAAYAADGWARTTGTPGVLCVTAGCGLTNALTGLCLAHATGSAIVCLAGQHPTSEDRLSSFQEAYGSEICRTFCKSAQRVIDWPRIQFDLRRAFRDSATFPQGPALVEFPTNILYHKGDETAQRTGVSPSDPNDFRSQGDPKQIERAVDLLISAERPLLVAGDGVFWSGASAEFQQLAELTHTPAYARRAGQGAVPEDHALAIRGAFKKPFTGRADVVITFGFRFWSGEKFGQPPTWSADAKYVQVGPVGGELGLQVRADVPIVGDPKLVLRQMIDAVRERKHDFAHRQQSQWLQDVAEARQNFQSMLEERAAQTHDRHPIHPDRLVRDLVSVMDRDASLIIDSFTLSGYTSHWFQSRFPGQLVDAGPLAPVGHGVGMGLGVQLARPGKQVVVVSGDGGIGIGGWDMETAAKYKLPIVVVLWNNSSWGPSFEEMPMLKGRTDAFDMLPNIRYDRIFEELGCHGEHVEQADEVRPALERALASGKPAVVNIIGDKTIGHPSLGGNLLGSTNV